MSKRKDRKQGTLFGGGLEAAQGERSDKDEALLQELAQTLLETKARDVVESRFRTRHPELHFKVRSRFSSYCNALAMLLKDELGDPLGPDDVLAYLQARFDSGEPLTVEKVLVAEPRLAQALVAEFGTIDAALEALDIRPDVAAEERRWERERIFHTVLELMGDSVGELTDSLVAEQRPLLCEVIRLEFGTFSSFNKEFASWVEAQAAVFLVWGRGGLSRVLTRNLPVTSRAAKGRNLADIERVKLCFTARPGYRLHLLSTAGLLYPVDTSGVPFVSFGAGEGQAAVRMPSLRRGEKAVALLSLDQRDGFLGMVSRQGRMKLVPVSLIKRVRSQGTVVMKLAPGDRVAAAATLPSDFARAVVVTRNGRSVAFARDGVKLSSRTSMGVYRLRFDGERGGEAVAVVGVGPEDDIILLGKNGNLIRLPPNEIPSRKGASLGRRVWRTPVIDAAGCPEAGRVLIATKRGRLLCFWGAEVPRRQAQRVGVMGIRLDGDDAPEMIGLIQ